MKNKVYAFDEGICQIPSLCSVFDYMM